MTLIQVGSLTLNFDLVAAVRDLGAATSSGLSIHFAQGLKIDVINPAEVQAIQDWLAAHSQAVPPSGP